MSDTSHASNTLELEVLEIQSDSDHETDQQRKSEKHKRYRRRSKNGRRKSKSQSCSSLCSFSSLKSPRKELRSEPNVSYYVDSVTGATVNLNTANDQQSSDLSKLPSFDDGLTTTGSCSHSFRDEQFNDLSGQTTAPLASGIKASFMTVLGKLGMWNNCKSQPQQSENGLPGGKGPPQSTTTSRLFRAFSFTGKFFIV